MTEVANTPAVCTAKDVDSTTVEASVSDVPTASATVSALDGETAHGATGAAGTPDVTIAAATTSAAAVAGNSATASMSAAAGTPDVKSAPTVGSTPATASVAAGLGAPDAPVSPGEPACEVRCATEADTKRLAASLAPLLQPGDALMLQGDLGAGKTQFVQGLALGLGVQRPVVSPTFNILLEYAEGSMPLYHFDLYRLDDESQLDDIGYYEVIESDGVTCIEWGDKFPAALPYDYVEIDISITQEGARVIRARGCGQRSCEVVDAWSCVEGANEE